MKTFSSLIKIISYGVSKTSPFAFRSIEVRHLLLDLDPYGGTDPLGMFPTLRELPALIFRNWVHFKQIYV